MSESDAARRTSEALIEAIKALGEQAFARGKAEGELAAMIWRHRALADALRRIRNSRGPRSQAIAMLALQADGEAP